jgi:hypothetical protein
MKADATIVGTLVEVELSRMQDAKVVALAREFGIEPRCEVRSWSYAENEHSCWLIFAHPESNTGVAYCEEGFGPARPWGLLWLTGDHLFMGDDSAWFPSLEEAIRDSFTYS